MFVLRSKQFWREYALAVAAQGAERARRRQRRRVVGRVVRGRGLVGRRLRAGRRRERHAGAAGPALSHTNSAGDEPPTAGSGTRLSTYSHL